MHFLSPTLANAWDVFLLFLIPIGGGIPAGVLLAKSRAIAWHEMTVLYFCSDVVLACLFEPIIYVFAWAGRHVWILGRIHAAMKQSMARSTARFGVHYGPFKLILIAFGVDPMTGRAAAKYAGHGFIAGWTLAIIGDMFFFAVIMGSTLWLNSVLGDGTWTAVIIMLAMFVIPPLIRRIKEHSAVR